MLLDTLDGDTGLSFAPVGPAWHDYYVFEAMFTTLNGKVVLKLKIAPSDAVKGLRIVSSELKAEALESKLLARIRQFDFGAKDVDQMVVTWPVDFLPS